jgi:4-amino-4-deoxy-L-arabinose transferase-like glycosyltransferase
VSKIKNKHVILLLVIFICHIFFRFYNLETWGNFGWDQVDNAWAAARILTIHKYPLIGMVAKLNSGIYIGPLYYYLVALVYFFTGGNPVASPILAGLTGIFCFWVIYYVGKNLFNKHIALVACIIYTFSSFIIHSERIQWPVNFIAPIALLVFYYLYRVTQGEFRYLIHLAIVVGLSFHSHFTAIFYPIIIILSLPLFPWSKKIWKYILAFLIIIFTLNAFQLVYYVQQINSDNTGKYFNYFQTYYHGFHMRRIIQLVHDAFIKFQQIIEIPYKQARNAILFVVPVFVFLFLRTEQGKNKLKFLYILTLWILVPWFVFATYSGEISDYYFSLQLYPAICIFAYITVWLWNTKRVILRVCLVAFWLYYAVANAQVFINTQEETYIKDQNIAAQAVDSGKYINFVEGDPKSYWYFYLYHKKTGKFPYEM